LQNRILPLLALLLAAAAACPGAGWSDLAVLFLVDRSGSMWAPWQERPKIVAVQEALAEVAEKIPGDLALGLRVYPVYPYETEARDPGLRIPIGTGNRDRFPPEIKRLNPQGKDALAGHLRSALQDFPDGAGAGILILICDGADVLGSSFCSMNAFEGLHEGVEFHILTLNLKDPSEQQELACLGKQLAGNVDHLVETSSLLPTVFKILEEAGQREALRQAEARRAQEEHRALREQTRLQVSFQNTLDPFFADSLEVLQVDLDGSRVPLLSQARLKTGEKTLLFDNPVSQGVHRLTIQYRLWSGEGSVHSRQDTLEVNLEKAQTLSILCSPQAKLLTWGCRFESEVVP